MFKLSLISGVILLTTFINAYVCLIGWKRHDTKTGLYFAIGMTSTTFWSLTVAMGYMAVPLEIKILFAKLDAIGYNFAIIFFLIAVLYFAGFDTWADDKWVRLFIFLIPTTNVLVTITNELHGWVWTGFTPIANNIYIFEHGHFFIWIAMTGYAMMISIVIILAWIDQKGPAIQRRQARLLLLATLFPIAANLIYFYGIKGAEGVDWSSVTFSITGFFFLWALQNAHFMDIIPIARDRLIASLSDGMVVVDTKVRIIEINPSAELMIGVAAKSLIGKSLQDIMPQTYAKLVETPDQEIHTEFESSENPKRYFDVLLSPLYDKGKTKLGNLIVFRNITDRKMNELQLQQLSHAVEQSPISVVITDKKGIITFVNPFFTTLTGYPPSEAIGVSPSISQSGQTPDEVYQEMWQMIQSGRKWEGELLNRKKNGDLYWEHEVVAPVLDANGNIYSFIAVKQDITERKLAEQMLENRFLEIQMLNKDLQEAQAQIVKQQRALATAEERQRLGRNLHDSVNQSIHSLMLFSETLIALLQNEEVEQAVHPAKRIHQSGEQALKEVRLLVHEGQAVFIGGYTDLIQAVENRLNRVERRGGIQTDFSYDLSVLERSPQGWMENIYWIILEGLNNSLKHSQASQVHVLIADGVNQLTVEVKDNGAGFNQSHLGGGGFGMRSMQERVEILGGVLSIESSPEEGTRVKVVVEIPN